MADELDPFEVTFVADEASARKAADALGDALEREARQGGQKAGEDFGRRFGRGAGEGARRMAGDFSKAHAAAADLAEDMRRLLKQSDAFEQQARTIGSANMFEGFNIGVRSARTLLHDLEENQERIARDRGFRAAYEQRGDIVRTFVSRQVALEQTLLAQQRQQEKDAANARLQTARLAANERTQILRQEHGQRVTAEQRAGALELAETRNAGRLKIAEEQRTGRARLELLRITGQQMRVLERAIASSIRGAGRALSGLGGLVARSTGRISGLFRRGNRDVTDGLAPALNRRESIFRRSMSTQENILRSSLTRQERLMTQFEARSATGLAGIASGRSRLGGALGLGAGVAGGAGLFRLISSGFERFSNLERLQKQFEALTGSQEVALGLLEQMEDFAKRTPFDLVGVADLAKGFLAIGTATEDVLPNVQTIADAVALTGGSADSLVRIQRAIGQVVSAGRLQGDELNQLAENLPGLNIRQILADQITGGDTAELVRMQEAGEISAEMFVNGILNGLSGDPRLEGASEDLAKTLSGRFANLGESFSAFGASLIGLIATPLKAAVRITDTALSGLVAFIEGDVSPAFLVLRSAVGGAVVALGGLIAAKAAAEFLGFLRLAIGAMLSPMGLLVGGVALLGGAIAVIAKRSPELREAFGELAGSIFDLAAPAVEFISDQLERFAGFLNDTAIPAIETFGSFLAGRIREGIEVIGGVMRDTVIPAFRDFIGFVRGTVIPEVRDRLVGAFNVARNALERFWGFVEPFLRPAIDGFKELGGAISDAVSGDFGGLLSGLGAAGEGIGATVTTIATSIVDAVTPIAQRAFERIRGVFSEANLRSFASGFLGVVEQIGFILGNIVSDPRFLAGVAAIAGAAVIIAGRFVEGFLRGVADNIPTLVGGLRDAIGSALREVFTNPALFAGIGVALIGGASLLALFRNAGRSWGAAAQSGFFSRLSAVQGGLTGSGNAVAALFGGLPTLQRQAASAARAASNAFITQFQAGNRRLQALGGNVVFGSGNAGQVREVNRRLAETTRHMGDAAVSAVVFRDAFGRAMRNAGRDSNNFRLAVQDMRANIGPVAASVGATIGNALGGAVVSAASGVLAGSSEGLTGQLIGFAGIAVSAIQTAAVAGPVAGAAVAGVGLVTAALTANAREAAKAKAEIGEYRDALLGIDDPAARAAAAIDTITANLRDESGNVTGLLREAGITAQEIATAAFAGDEAVAGLRDRIREAGDGATEFKAVRDALDFVNDEVGEIRGGLEAAELEEWFSGSAREASALSLAAGRVTGDLSQMSNIAIVAGRAFDIFQQVRTNHAAEQAQDARDALDEARNAADEAREALIRFLRGDDQGGIEEQVTGFLSGLAGLDSSISAAIEQGGVVGAASLESALSNVNFDVGEIIAAGVAEGVTPEVAVQGLREQIWTAISQGVEGGGISNEAGVKILQEIDAAIALANSDAGQVLIDAAVDADAAETSAAAAVTAAQAIVDANTVQFSTSIDENEARQQGRDTVSAFRGGIEQVSTHSTGASLVDGVIAGMASRRAAVLGSARRLAADVDAEIRAELGIHSPSTRMAEVGGFIGEGIAVGMFASLAVVSEGARRLTAAIADSGVGEADSSGRRIGASLGDAISQAIADEGNAAVNSVNTLFDQVTEAALSRSQLLASTISSGTLALFGNTNQLAFPGALPEAQLQRAFLQVADIPTGFRSAVEGVAGDIWDATVARNAGERITSGQRDLVGESFLSLNTSDAAGRRNRGAFLEAGEGIREYSEALIAAGRPLDSVVFETKAWRDNLIDTAKSMGFSTAGINEMIKQLGLSDSQLNEFIASVKRLREEAESPSAPTPDPAEEERRRREAEAEAERLQREREQREREEEERRRREFTLDLRPMVGEITVISPSTDPEAVSLHVVNRIAMSLPRG